jgi:sarcosine oxidase
MNTTYDVIVLGVGAMGAAACWRLATRGARVLGLEQNGVPNALGSSHGYTRMTRSAYCEHPDYVPLVRRANILWQELESASGLSLLNLCGALHMGAPDGDMIGGSVRAADQHAVPYDLLDRSALHRLFPQFRVPDHFVGLLEQEAGYLRPEPAVAAMADQAMRHGAAIHGCEKVLDWSETASGSVVVTSEEGTYTAGRLIIAGGPWSGSLARGLGIELRVTRQVLAWVWPAQPELFSSGRIPVWSVAPRGGDDGLYYGFPMLADNPGLKIALHLPGEDADPDHLERSILPSDAETVKPFLKTYLPDADGPLLAIRICMYTNSPDHHFIVGRLPGSEAVTIACGFSGHGFKFAPAIGEALADLAQTGQTTLPIGFLSPTRFS